MIIRIAGINKLSMVNGDGARLVIFLQGCGAEMAGVVQEGNGNG